jgi:uncharacterized protein YprB with RNaseH-like and TPR domain
MSAMGDDALRGRLEALNRGVLPEAAVRALRRPAAEAASPVKAAWRSGVVRPLPGLVRRGDVVANDAGEHLRIELRLDELWPGGAQLVERRREALVAAGVPSGDATDWGSQLPHGVVFLDLETCGLAGSALFLAGLLRSIDGRLTVELLLARDYSEESAVLASLWQRLASIATIVTFNGKSFDWPMVLDRSRRHLLTRAQLPAEPQHVDLLHLARRRWRRELPNCKLQTLEQRICGRTRTDDMPGSQIPAAYHQFVRTGFEREMDGILLHNAIDLVTMIDLAMRLAGS